MGGGVKKKTMWEEIKSEMHNCLSLVVLSGSRKSLVVFVTTLVNHSQEHKLLHKRLVGSFKMEKKIKSGE